MADQLGISARKRRTEAMGFEEIARMTGALIITIGFILGFYWVARRYGPRLGLRAPANPSDLGVIEWKVLDVRRKLAVVRWDGREHLLCLGPAGDIVIAERPAPTPSARPDIPT
jgi:flagellar protein FliO/FliZ